MPADTPPLPRADLIDLRSDTMTRPTAGMREAMARALVGDDMVSEDPTVNALQERVATMFGKQAALFVPSGTMSNQIAVNVHTQPGQQILIDEFGHIANYEAGGPAFLSGVSTRFVSGHCGMLDVACLEEAWSHPTVGHPSTRLLCLENTTNIGGGKAYSLTQFQQVCQWGREKELKIHLDGARIFNATIAMGYDVKDLASEVDSISVCFSKGLGCPVGSILIGDADFIAQARKIRKIFGGAMRQAGVLAAAAMYALDHHLLRLEDDHQLAKRLAEGLAQIPGILASPYDVETNIVFFEVDPQIVRGKDFVKHLAEVGVMFYDLGPQRIRALTHLDISADQIETAICLIARQMTTFSSVAVV